MYVEKNTVSYPHRLILEDRSRLTVTGVEDVESFDEEAIVMLTAKGALQIRGTNLRVDKLSLEGGELTVEGLVESLQYEDKQPEGQGFFSRLFR